MINSSKIDDNFFEYDAVSLNETEDALLIIDQTELPNKEVFLELKTLKDISDAIYLLKIRGAPAIGVAAAYGICMCTLNINNKETYIKEFKKAKNTLNATRPTAVNLTYALNRMDACLDSHINLNLNELKTKLLEESKEVKKEDMNMCYSIAENALSLIQKGSSILTHCNAGHLAVSRYGTALGPIYLAQHRGYNPKVFADETRPLLQGARLTTFELMKSGVDVTLVCDNMASILMKKGKVDMVMVGCDRVASNGDVANKIGTSSLAILANYYNIPFYVLGPTTTIDLNCKTGDDIFIEERPAYEVTSLYFSKPIAPKGVKVYNPAFDVTDSKLITAIITEKGVYRYPYNFLKGK
ncbi:MAG: S-methyl-5-thioribose-1-phosphate isomerase [Bacteroidales bacterium]